MKTIKSLFGLSLILILFSFVLSGCYTQLALMNDEQDSAVAPIQDIPYQPGTITVIVPMPDDHPFFHQISNTIPTAGAVTVSDEKRPIGLRPPAGARGAGRFGALQFRSRPGRAR